ncbi:MAG: (2Fe-2S)-binding protein, partial [Planctomycetaceae bacterium]|nr:(2Fe-2S)-binding protein [Planctomycetaceae bacterium]
PGLRLSCQIACNEDMEVKPISRLEGSGRADAGGRPGDEIEPAPEWC